MTYSGLTNYKTNSPPLDSAKQGSADYHPHLKAVYEKTGFMQLPKQDDDESIG